MAKAEGRVLAPAAGPGSGLAVEAPASVPEDRRSVPEGSVAHRLGPVTGSEAQAAGAGDGEWSAWRC
jgi:hypothetical protein